MPPVMPARVKQSGGGRNHGFTRFHDIELFAAEVSIDITEHHTATSSARNENAVPYRRRSHTVYRDGAALGNWFLADEIDGSHMAGQGRFSVVRRIRSDTHAIV